MATPAKAAVYPKTDYVSIEFFWMSIEDILQRYMPGDGSIGWRVLEVKRGDEDYEELVNDLAAVGFFDPVYVDRDTAWFHNGHHRLAAAIDLGYTHIPVTDDEEHGFDETSPLRCLH